MSVYHPVIYRDITRKDYGALEAFITHLYNSSGSFTQSQAQALARLCLYDSLYSRTYARVACLGNRIIGFISGRYIPCQKYHWEAAVRRKISVFSLQLTPKRRYCYRAYRFFQQTDKKLLSLCTEPFEGELLFIAVSPQFRHQGIGLTLLGGFHKYMLSHNVRQIYLFTDSSCCFGFYDRQRFERLYAYYFPVKPSHKEFAFYLYKFSYY